MICCYLSLCLFAISAHFVASEVALEGIIGGEIAEAYQFRYQATLVIESKDQCGAGIIGDQFILTAAHCVLRRRDGEFINKSIIVVAGTNDLNKTDAPAVLIQVKKIYVPIEYDRRVVNSSGDIAVLKLEHSLNLARHEHLEKLELPKNESETYDGKKAEIAGFGWTWVKVLDYHNNSVTGCSNDTYLRYVVADILGRGSECYRLQTANSEKHICARVEQRDHSQPFGICNGDSGGPLVYHRTVVGILSATTPNCSEREIGALYTRVSHYLKFIVDAMKNIKNYSMRIHKVPRKRKIMSLDHCIKCFNRYWRHAT